MISALDSIIGIKCGLDEAALLQEHFLEYCGRRTKWDPSFAVNPPDEMISSMERMWTWKFLDVIHNLQKSKTDMNYRMKHLLLDLNEVILCRFVDL